MLTNNNQKGFTLAELIVVIVIIAVLASIVMISVAQYIGKAKDARIKSDMVNIALAMAACFSSNGTYQSYNGSPACFDNTIYVSSALKADITSANGNNGGVLVENNSATAYCLSTQLASDDNVYVCVDSIGVTKTSATAICTSSNVCPN